MKRLCGKLRTTTRNAPSSGWKSLSNSPRTSTMGISVSRRNTEKPAGWMPPNKEFTRAFELNPREGTPLIQLGEIYLEKSNFERAADVFSQAIRVEPGSAVAHYALGRARYRLSEYAEAEQAFTRAALLDKDFEAAELMLLH